MNLKDYRERAERGVSINDVIAELILSKQDIDAIAVVTISKDKEIEANYSASNKTELIGAVEIMKQDLILEEVEI